MATNTFNNPSSFGSFVPTTNVWDVGEILAAPEILTQKVLDVTDIL